MHRHYYKIDVWDSIYKEITVCLGPEQRLPIYYFSSPLSKLLKVFALGCI